MATQRNFIDTFTKHIPNQIERFTFNTFLFPENKDFLFISGYIKIDGSYNKKVGYKLITN
jgi:hypothetical protein